MPNIDPKVLKSMMDRMGIKSSEIEAEQVIIKCKDMSIVIDNPNVMSINAQGTTTFQISGSISEKPNALPEISKDDIDFVASQTGINDQEKIRSAIEDADGDLATAIMKLKNSK